MDVLAHYAALVRSFAPRLNLVASDDLDRFEERHIDDSLRALDLVRHAPPGPCADLGSGAGLPGVPLAISTPDRLWRLIEPRRRRAAFLEEVIRELGLNNVEVVALTGEGAALRSDLATGHAFVTARALAEPSRAVELMLPLLAPDGVGLVFLGRDATPPVGTQEWRPGLAIVRASSGQVGSE